MGVLRKALSRLIRIFRRQPCKKAAATQTSAAVCMPRRPDIAKPISSSCRIAGAMDLPDEEIAAVASRFAFVLTNERPPLNPADQWWNEETHRCRIRDGSAEMYVWMEPFLPIDLAEQEQLHSITMEWGPLQAPALAKALRERVRTCRMHKQPHEHLLRALYGACVMADFVQALRIDGRQPDEMTCHVDINELRAITIDYASLGYQCIESLGKTDREWLVETFGEPKGHQSFDAAFPAPLQNAVNRCYWSAYREAQEAMRSIGASLPTMQEWLHERVKHTVAYYRDWQKRLADRVTWDADVRAALGAAWLASTKNFVVADVETTGRNVEKDEIVELAALRVSPTGKVLDAFNVRVKAHGTSSAAMARTLSNGTQNRPAELAEKAIADFLRFVGADSVFLHNAPFGTHFLKKAAVRFRRDFSNPSHDILPLARAAWPELGRYDLASVAAHLGVPSASQRPLSNAKSALAVLLAARKVAAPMQFYGGTERELYSHRVQARDLFAPLPLSSEHASS